MLKHGSPSGWQITLVGLPRREPTRRSGATFRREGALVVGPLVGRKPDGPDSSSSDIRLVVSHHLAIGGGGEDMQTTPTFRLGSARQWRSMRSAKEGCLERPADTSMSGLARSSSPANRMTLSLIKLVGALHLTGVGQQGAAPGPI